MRTKTLNQIAQEAAKKLRKESSPEALESERAANALLTEDLERKDKLIEQMREALDATDEYYLDKSYAGKAHNTPIVVKVREAQAALEAAERGK